MPRLKTKSVPETIEREKEKKRAQRSTSSPRHAEESTPMRVGSGDIPSRLALALRHTTSNRTLRRLAEGEFTLTPEVETRLAQEQGRGEPLEEGMRAQMEGALGADLSAVRIHRDGVANELAQSMNARAFTLGADVFFSSGEYAPETETGQHTLAHELTHVIQGHAGATLVVGSAHDPAEAEADAVANQVVKRLREEGSPVVSRQTEETEEEGEVQTLRRQEEDEEEEEEVQTLRRQEEEEEEEEVQALRRQAEDEEEEEEKEETAVFPRALRLAQATPKIRRRVTVDVITQTATREAIQQMTTIELREQIARLNEVGMLSEPQSENLILLEQELERREAEIAALGLEDLDRSCNRELERLQFWMLSPGGLPLQTLRAFDSAVGNFVQNTEVSAPEGIGFADIFGIALELVPGIGPVARWIGDIAIREAAVNVLQATAEVTAEAIETGIAGTTAEQEQGARATFSAQVRREGAALADTLARHTDQALNMYRNAVDSAHRAGNAAGLRTLLISLQHENDLARAVTPEQFNELSRQFEIELYHRYYQTRAYIHVIEHNVWGVMSREVRGIPSSVQEALIQRLRASSSMLDLAESWHLPEHVTHTSGGPF